MHFHRYIVLFFILFFAQAAFAANVKVLEAKYVFDKNNSYNVTKVHEQKDNLQNLDYKNASFGFSKDPLWIYIKVRSTSETRTSEVIEFLYTLHDYIDVYRFCKGELQEHYLTGDLTKHNTRKIDINNMLIPYTIAPQTEKEFIFKIQSQSNLSIGMRFYDIDEFIKKSATENMLLLMYYGAVLIMLLYNSLLFFIVHDKVYIYYVLFHLTLSLSFFTSNGLAFTYFWPNHPEINKYFLPLVFISANFFSVVFTISFLELKKYTQKLYKYLLGIMLVDIGFFIALFYVGYPVLEKMLMFSLISVVSLLVSSFYVLVKFKTSNSKFFVIAWSIFLFSTIAEELQGLGVINMGDFISYSSQGGAFIELTLLSIALAYKYNVVHKELIKKELQISAFNAQLQDKVDQQTVSLKLLIKELHHRVKNNLQIVLTFLWSQKTFVDDKKSIDALGQTIDRIYAISSLHEQFSSADSVTIDIKEYLNNIVESYKETRGNSKYNLNIDDISLNHDYALTMGIVLNELITNSNKYAKKSTQNLEIDISLTSDGENYIFTYKDNGEGFESSKLTNSMGLGYELISNFAKKNNAEIVLSTEKGMNLTLIFKEGLNNDT